MRDKRGNETELLRYLNALRSCIAQSKHTERIDGKYKAEESGHIFRAIFENAADGILLIDLENKKFFMGNRVLCQMLGYSQHELKMLEVADIHPEEDLPYVTEQFEKQAGGELTLAGDIPVERKDGSILYVEINSFPITFGRKTYLMGIFRDITERKKTEEALRKREEQYRSVVEDSPGLLCSFLPDGTINFVNAAYCEYFGKSYKELIGSKFTSLIPEEDAQGVLNNILSLTVDSPILTHEHKIFAPDGQIRWQQWTNRALFDEQGRAVLFQSFGEDITERKRAEEALARSEKKWYSLLRNAPDFILNLDSDGTILFINRTVPGYTLEETIGRTVYDFLPPEEHEKTREAINKVFETGKQVKFGTRVIGPDGKLLWYLNHLGPIKDGDTVVSVAQVSTNITESKQIQVRLQTKNAAIASSINGIAIADVEGNLTYVNKSFLEMWGYGQENEVLGRNAVTFHHEPDQVLEVMEALRGRGSWIGELTAIKKDGSVRDVQVCATSVIDENNRPISMMASFIDITERKKGENELRKFKAVADRAGYGVAMIDLERRLTYINEQFTQMHGYEAGELIGKDLSVFHSEGQMKNIDRHIQKLRETGSFVSEEVWHTKKDGTDFCTLMNGTLIRDEHGEPQFMACTEVDITRRKKMETALAESEEKYRTLVEGSTDAICIINRHGNFLFANRKAVEIVGVQREKLVGKTMWDFFPKEVADRRIAAVLQVIESKQDMSIVRRTELRGQLFWYHTKLLPMRDSYGETLVMTVSRDVSDIKQAEERIRTLSSAVEQSIDGISISNLERKLQYVNAAFAHMHGFAPEEMVRMDFLGLRSTQLRDELEKIVHQIETHGSWTGETEHIRKDGTVFPCYLSVTYLEDERGEPAGRIAICRDIAEYKKREQELAIYREHMARAEQLASLGTLSATIAHQVTQPLTVIRLSLDNVVDELERTSCSNTVLRRLRDSITQVSNITTIINRFRTFARHSSDTAFDQINVHAVAVRIARLLAESARQARVTLHVEDMSILPPVLLHEREFEQILFALIENAIQAADGEKVRQIVISGSVKDEQIELRFSDNCAGIPPENRDKIFEPFFTTKPRGQGTGLGLCIVQDAVARVGGRVRVESKWGRGSTFFVTLPVDDD